MKNRRKSHEPEVKRTLCRLLQEIMDNFRRASLRSKRLPLWQVHQSKKQAHKTQAKKQQAQKMQAKKQQAQKMQAQKMQVKSGKHPGTTKPSLDYSSI